MSQNEFEAWRAYHRTTPLDDERRIYRVAGLICAILVRGKQSVQHFVDMLTPRPANYSDADLATLKAFGIKPRRE